MNEKKELLNKINNFKTRIIKYSKEKQSFKNNDNKSIQQNIDKNLIYINNITKQEPRNTTAPNNMTKKQKGNKHMKITAKDKENNIHLSSVKNLGEKLVDKFISKKISTRSTSKNDNPNKNKNLVKNLGKNKIKRVNSSNNIKIVNDNAIDYFTQKMLEGSKTNSNAYRTNNINKSNNRISEFDLNNIVQSNQMGLFNINLRSNIENLDYINNNKHIYQKKENKGLISTAKGNFSQMENNKMNSNSNKNLTAKLKNDTNSILDSISVYKIKRSSSIEQEINNLKKQNNKEIQRHNHIINENKLIKTVKNSRTIENEKADNKTNKNLNKTIKSKNEQLTSNIKNKNNNIYQYLILKGNASYLVKYCMYHRINWVEAPKPEPDRPDYDSNIFNFKWKELSYGIDYFSLNKNPKMKQIVNHFEFHHVISNKSNMFINMMKYCEKRNLSVFKYVPFTIVFKIKDRRKIKNKEKQKRWNAKLEKLKNFIQNIEKNVKNYNEIGKYYFNEDYINDREKRYEFEKMKQNAKESKKSKEEEKDNKEKEKKVEEIYKGKFEVYSDIFPRLKREKAKKNKSNEENGKEKKFIKPIGSNTLIEIPDTHYKGRNMWVLKAVNLNRGMCIKVVNSFEQMEKVINKFKNGVDYSNFTVEKIEEEEKTNNNDILVEDNSNNLDKKEEKSNKYDNNKIEENKNNNNIESKKEENENDKEEKIYNCNKILIQKYIENPLLYKGRKCDMRIWVLLTHQKKVFLFKEGHLKTCSVQYDINSKDAFTHITNYSFQKHNDNFQKFEKGNEVPFYEFQKFIDEKYPEKNYKLNRDLMKQIKDIISVSMRCGKNTINKFNRNFQFEIFGYDFMLDNDFNAFLIEINTNPGLEISSPWIQIVVPRMLDDALRLTVDKVFEPIYDFNKNYKGEYTEQQKQLLIDSKIKYDFNAVNPIITKKESTSLTSSILSKTSGPSSKIAEPTSKTGDKIFDINLDLDELDKKLIKEENKENNQQKENDESTNDNDTNKIEESKKIKPVEENKFIKNNKLKYITPFPVPGYSLDENLWDFVCDLNEKDPNDISNNNEKDNKEKNSFTGIRHLLKKRTNNPKKKEKIKK